MSESNLSRNGPALSAAIEALAITMHETTQMAYSLDRVSWHDLTEVQRGDYRGDAIKDLEQRNPRRVRHELRNPDYFARCVDLTRSHARVIGAIAPEGGE